LAGGWVFGIARVGLVHSMAHSVVRLSSVPHGGACGILLSAVIRFKVVHTTEKLALASQVLSVSIVGVDKREMALAPMRMPLRHS